MRLKNIITIIFIISGISISSAQSSRTQSLHSSVHKQQLANAKSRMDKSVIESLIKQDIERKEESSIGQNKMSAQLSAMANDLLSEARKHIGKRYKSGAKGPSAFDCSGFSSYVFRQFGYSLGSSSRDQYSQGEPVEKNNLREGDLVFFKGSRNSKNIGHVGIVVSANNEKGTFTFIHASTSQGIKIDNSGGYYASRYVGARRILTEDE